MHLYSALLESPLGPIAAIADEKALFLLEFIGCRGMEREVERLKEKTGSAIVQGWTDPLRSIESELKAYFNKKCAHFETPIALFGTPFQNCVWKELLKIPSGETRAYADIARGIGKPAAVRAVANANGANQLAILIPCHRVIHTSGGLGGYGGGISRKQWLLDHERSWNV